MHDRMRAVRLGALFAITGLCITLASASPVIAAAARPQRVSETSASSNDGSDQSILLARLSGIATGRQNLVAAISHADAFSVPLGMEVDASSVRLAVQSGLSILQTKVLYSAPAAEISYATATAAIGNALATATAKVEAAQAVIDAAQAAAASAAAAAAAEAASHAAAHLAATRRAGASVTKQTAAAPYVLRVSGIASNQAGIDSCGLMDVSSWMGAGPELAAHWSCGHGGSVPRDAGHLFTVVNGGSLDGNYVSLGIIGYLNVHTQTTNDIPRGYDLLLTSCYFNDSSHEMLLAFRRV